VPVAAGVPVMVAAVVVADVELKVNAEGSAAEVESRLMV